MATMANPISALTSAGFDVLNLGMHLLAAHDQRIQVAREENSAVQQAVTTMDADRQTIYKAANEGLITAAAAAAAILDVHTWYWAFLTPLIQGPTKGPTAPFPNPGAPNNNLTGGIYYEATDGAACHCAGEKIGNVVGCTAGCCIGCAAIDPTLSNDYVTFMRGGGSVIAAPIVANKYGLQTRAPYTLTYVKPKVVTPEELTINKNTGVVTVGAPPSSSDAVIQTGAESTQAAPDQGGVTITTPSTTIAGTATAPISNTPNQTVSSALGGITQGDLLIGAGIVLFAFLFSFMGRRREY